MELSEMKCETCLLGIKADLPEDIPRGDLTICKALPYWVAIDGVGAMKSSVLQGIGRIVYHSPKVHRCSLGLWRDPACGDWNVNVGVEEAKDFGKPSKENDDASEAECEGT